MSYTIQSPAATMTFDPYTASNAGYAIGTISYTATYSSGLALDSWIVFDDTTRTFTVESDDNAKFAGSPYTIKISASESGALGLPHHPDLHAHHRQVHRHACRAFRHQ